MSISLEVVSQLQRSNLLPFELSMYTGEHANDIIFLPLTCEQIHKSDPDQFSLLVVFNPFIVLFYCFFFNPLPAFITKPLSEPNTGKKHVNSGFIFINHKSYSCMEKIIRHSAETAARIDMSFITRNNARNSSYSNIKKFYNTLKSDVPHLESFCSKANGEKERF